MKRLIIASVWLVVAALALVAVRTEEPRTVTVMFPDAAGLFVGNDVGVLGIPIGTVVSLEPEGRAVKARLEITDDDVKLPADVGAAVVTRSIAADRYVELTPAYDGGPTLKDGAVIPTERTATPVDFDRALASMAELSDDLADNPEVTTNLRDFIETSATTLDGNGQVLHDATENLAGALSEVNGQRNTIVGTVRSMTELATALNANEGTVRAFIDNLSAAAGLLADERLHLGAALTSLSASIDDVSRLARRHRKAFRADAVALTEVLRNTVASQGDLKEALDTLPLLGQNLSRTEDRGRVRFQVDLFQLTPLGPYVDKLCQRISPVCDGIAVTLDPKSLLDLVLAPITGGAE